MSSNLEIFKPLARKLLPFGAREWIHDRQQRISEAKRDLYERVLPTKRNFRNSEGLVNYNFSLVSRHRPSGVSALLRVKNEGPKIYYCLKSIYTVFDEIVFVDNGSDDNTLAIVREFKLTEDNRGKLKVYSFPFKQARFGPEHNATPADSVHSFVYYSNWSLSQCSYNYVCKWDGDMVLRRESRDKFNSFLKTIQHERKFCWILFGQTVYRDRDNNHFLATGEINGEVRLFPNGLNPTFRKVDPYEMLVSDPPLEERPFDELMFFELKFVNTDEFSHWNIGNFPTERKRRELQNFRLVKENQVSGAIFKKLTRSFLDDQLV